MKILIPAVALLGITAGCDALTAATGLSKEQQFACAQLIAAQIKGDAGAEQDWITEILDMGISCFLTNPEAVEQGAAPIVVIAPVEHGAALTVMAVPVAED